MPMRLDVVHAHAPVTAAARTLSLLALALLAACGSTPRNEPAAGRPARSEPGAERDGPGANPPPDLWLVPDAVPRLEPLRSGGPNKPYEVDGRSYVPLTGDVALRETGLASWYGRKFHGRGTATGEPYDMYAMTAAHRTMPLPSYARVRNPANGREVIVRVNDRGPFHDDRVIDLSYTAALKLGLLAGVAPVEVERITTEAIRSGSWRPTDDGRALAAAGSARPALAEPDPGVADPIAEFARRAEPPARTAAPAAPPAGFWVQLGAFRERDGAAAFQQRVAREADWLAPLLAIVDDRSLHRLQAGPYSNRGDAGAVAERLGRLLQLSPTVVERR